MIDAQYARFLGLRAMSERALDAGELAEAERCAQELLDLAEHYRGDWYYGNAVHHAHLLLGRVALARENVAGAITHLHDAGRTPGSPQLNSFGPNMRLALALLRAGEAEEVVAYLDLCRRFWRSGPVDRWIGAIRSGREPEFGPNLLY